MLTMYLVGVAIGLLLGGAFVGALWALTRGHVELAPTDEREVLASQADEARW